MPQRQANNASTARSIEGIEVAIVRADIDDSVSNGWRRADDVLPSGGGPEETASVSLESIQLMVVGADVDHAISHCWCRTDGGPNGYSPHRSTRGSPTTISLEGIELAIIGADIDPAVGHCWRGLNTTSSRSCPERWAGC